MAKTNKTNNTMATIELNAETVAILEQIIAQFKANQTVSEPKKATATKATKKSATAKAVESKPAKTESKASAKATKPATKVTKTTAHWVRNTECKGIEIAFTGKPDSTIRESLKKAGYRWHNAKKVWYAKETADRVNVAIAVCGGVVR